MNTPILRVKDLSTTFTTSSGQVRAVDGVSFNVNRGEVLGIVGESGSGKSASMLSLIGLAGNTANVQVSSATFNGVPFNAKALRGKSISMIFQDPMTSLNPVLSVGYQLKESLRRHKWQGDIEGRCIEVLERAGIVPARERLKQYPHEFSGGQRQRIMIAMAIICGPELLIADEPTTALDVTVQAQILELLRELRRESGMSMILITHDLGVIAGEADRVLVMYGGRIMEQGTVREIFYSPEHPYTKGLLRSVPNPERPNERLIPIEGQPPDFCYVLVQQKGCPYAERCPQAMRICLERKPEEYRLSETHSCLCWLGAGGRVAANGVSGTVSDGMGTEV